ncbi:MAG TPA: hypothetical protein VK110_02570 [Salinisphaeraceae bacterium]|nr:hypothetical protein [Salinisphaeraceae bacterium]
MPAFFMAGMSTWPAMMQCSRGAVPWQTQTPGAKQTSGRKEPDHTLVSSTSGNNISTASCRHLSELRPCTEAAWILLAHQAINIKIQSSSQTRAEAAAYFLVATAGVAQPVAEATSQIAVRVRWICMQSMRPKHEVFTQRN